MKKYSEITLKYLKANKKRTFLTVIGIILSVALFTGIGTILFSYRASQIEDAKQSLGNYEFKYDNISSSNVEKMINNAEVLNFGIEERWEKAEVKVQNENLNLEVRAYDKNSFKNIMNRCFEIKKGRFPKKENEIMLDMGTSYQLKDKKIGDSITISLQNNETKNYKIVGTYEYNSLAPARAITFINFNNKDTSKFNVFVNLKEKRNKEKVANRIAKESGLKSSQLQIEYNDVILRSYLQSPNELRNDFIVKIIVFLISIIVVSSAALIYNSFNISVMERIKHFGILRSIGATPKQIKSMVIREAAYMCLVGIPIGCLAGYLGIYLTVKLMGKLSFIGSSNFKIGVYPVVFIISAVLSVFTILLSAFNPVRRAGRISPMDALKNTIGIKNKKLKKRNSKIIKLLFGNEGELAYKNIKRLPGRFWVTVFSLVISIIMFIVFTTFASFVKQMDNDSKKITPYDSILFKNNAKGGLSTEDYEQIKKSSGVKKVYKLSDAENGIYIASDKLNVNFYKKTSLSENKPQYKNFTETSIDISLYDDNALELAKKYISSGEINKDKLNNNGVLIVNKNKIQTSDRKENKKVFENYSTYKVGDKIVIPKMKNYLLKDSENAAEDADKEQRKSIDNKEFVTLTVVGILNVDPINNNNDGYPIEGMNFIFTEDMYKKLNGKIDYDGFGIVFNDKTSRDKLYKSFEDKAAEVGGYYTDFYKIAEDNKKSNFEMEVFVYGFISIITLISAVNIINTVSINIILRKAEFAMLMAIGMTKEQLTKMVLLEGTLHGIIAAVLGTFIGGALDFILIKIISGSEFRDFNLKLPIVAIVGEVIAAIIITLIASAIPLRKLKNMNVVENLNQE
ncbi:ABC transporter permease [Clostridium hydrogenum]|uniref:ABC transporter permease n=1 Tax=Clostridium hydrogenum TaxID=2855764 RepID=UPI001F32C0C8|nr:ABC transporter permease [Clostridium hydrogenum]